jgi:hypothetical protein
MHCARLVGLCVLLAAAQVSAEPFLTRDQNVLLGGDALPLPVPSDLTPAGSTRIDIAVNWSSTASSGLTAGEALLIDIESREVRVLIEHSLLNRYAVRLQLPYRQVTAGVLDGFIDGWHALLGLPEGARKFLERDQFQIGYVRGAQTILNRREPMQGLGDIVLEGGYQVWQSQRSSGAFWLSLEAPSGSESKLLGNGTWDAGIRLSGRNTLSARNSAYWQAGATLMGSGGPLMQWQKDWAFSGSGTYDFSATPALHLKAQIDAHSALYKSGVDFLGKATILTVGGDYRYASGLRLDIGISEDIEVGASPDVNFCFSLSQSF